MIGEKKRLETKKKNPETRPKKKKKINPTNGNSLSLFTALFVQNRHLIHYADFFPGKYGKVHLYGVFKPNEQNII